MPSPVSYGLASFLNLLETQLLPLLKLKFRLFKQLAMEAIDAISTLSFSPHEAHICWPGHFSRENVNTLRFFSLHRRVYYRVTNRQTKKVKKGKLMYIPGSTGDSAKTGCSCSNPQGCLLTNSRNKL